MVRFIASALVLAVASFSMAEEKAKFDPKSITGKWTITAGVKYGEKLEAKHLEGDVTITADKITIKSPDITHEMTYKLDATKSPVAIDLTGTEGPAKGLKTEGIIEIKEGVIHLVYGFPGEPRPAKFESPKESKILFFTLKAKK